jgi:hypothetical protein
VNPFDYRTSRALMKASGLIEATASNRTPRAVEASLSLVSRAKEAVGQRLFALGRRMVRADVELT